MGPAYTIQFAMLFGLATSLFVAGCQEATAPAAPPVASVHSTTTDSALPSPTPPETSPHAKTPAPSSPAAAEPTASPARPRDITFDDLKFEMEKGGDFKRDMLTDEIEALVGKSIRIRGYILPSFQQTGLTQFVLVRDNMECCFGPGAALYDCILVEMAEGKTATFSVRPVAVEGKFAIDELIGPDRKHLAIFRMTADEVE